MTNIHSDPTPLRQKFIEYLALNRKAKRTIHCYVSFIYSLAKHYHRSPDRLSPEDIQHWLYHLIAERKQAPSTINLAINAVRSFYGKLLQQDIEPLLHPGSRPGGVGSVLRPRPAAIPRLVRAFASLSPLNFLSIAPESAPPPPLLAAPAGIRPRFRPPGYPEAPQRPSAGYPANRSSSNTAS